MGQYQFHLHPVCHGIFSGAPTGLTRVALTIVPSEIAPRTFSEVGRPGRLRPLNHGVLTQLPKITKLSHLTIGSLASRRMRGSLQGFINPKYEPSLTLLPLFLRQAMRQDKLQIKWK